MPVLLVLGLAFAAAAPGAALADPTWKSTIFELDLYGDRVAGAPSLEHLSGYFPAPDAGGPPSGQAFLESGPDAGLPIHSYAQDFVKVRDQASVTFTFYPGTILPVRARTLYLLVGGDQIYKDWSGWEIAEVRLDFADGTFLDSAALPALKLVAGENLRNAISWIGEDRCLTSFSSPALAPAWSGPAARAAFGTAYLDVLTIPLPRDLGGADWTLKALSSITLRSLRGAHTPYPGGPTWHPGINVFGLTAPGFRPYPHGFFFANAGARTRQIALAYEPPAPLGGFEANYHALWADTFSNVRRFPATTPAGDLDWTDISNRTWGGLMGVLTDRRVSRRDGESAGGVCFGMAAASLLLYAADGSLATTAYERTPDRSEPYGFDTLLPVPWHGDAPQDGNSDVQLYRWILHLFYRQFNDTCQEGYKTAKERRPSAQFAEVLDLMLTGRPFVLGTFDGGDAGHAVAPTHIVQSPSNPQVYWLYVYDNETPDRSSPTSWLDPANALRVEFDLAADRFVHAWGEGADQVLDSERGAYLAITPLDRVLADDGVWPEFFANAAKIELFRGDSPVGSLGVTDAAGRRLGTVAGARHDEIPEAWVAGATSRDDPVRVWALPPETYTVAHEAAAPGEFSFWITLPGGEVRYASAATAGTDEVTVSRDGRTIEVSTTDPETKTADLEVAVYGASAERAAFVYTLDALDVAADGPVTIALDAASRALTLTNAGATPRAAAVAYTPGDGPSPGIPVDLGVVTVAAGASAVVSGGGPPAEAEDPTTKLSGGGCGFAPGGARGGGAFEMAVLLLALSALRSGRSGAPR